MIHSVTANMPQFRTVSFSPGMNVVLAERSENASQRDSRNGLGKSTLIDIIHFCLGATARKGAGLLIGPLEGWRFTLDITIAGTRVKVSRAIDAPNYVAIDGDTASWPIQPVWNEEADANILEVGQWNIVQGNLVFGLSLVPTVEKYRPSFRSLISYFARRGEGAYQDPFRHLASQNTWNIQVQNAFLLGLSWEKASQWQILKDKEDLLKAIAKGAKTGVLEEMVGSIGKLEAEKLQVVSQVKEEREALKGFRVHSQYEQLQKDADHLTRELHLAANANIKDRRLLALYQQTVKEEQVPGHDQLESLYDEVGVVFPDAVKTTLSDAREFHKQLIVNRRQFLANEIERIEQRVIDRKGEISHLMEERAALLEILATHGAFEEFSRLQEEHLKTVERLRGLDTRISQFRDMEEKRGEVKVGKVELLKTARLDYEERRGRWEKAVTAFNANSQALYDSPGSLVIDLTDKGYKFGVDIKRSDSQGVSKMKVFCYDIMLAETHAKAWPGFIIHDSLVFDGVDSRQRALALELAASKSASLGYQYICALNSDTVPEDDFSGGFNLDDYVSIRFSDEDENEGLLGFRF